MSFFLERGDALHFSIQSYLDLFGKEGAAILLERAPHPVHREVANFAHNNFSM